MSRASDAAMDALHASLASLLKDSLEPKTDPITGASLPPNPALLSVARQFLKDNHIECGAGAPSVPLAGLAGLPEFSEDGNVVPISQRK